MCPKICGQGSVPESAGGAYSIPLTLLLSQLHFAALVCGKVSLWLCESLGNVGSFFLLLYGHPVYIRTVVQ